MEEKSRNERKKLFSKANEINKTLEKKQFVAYSKQTWFSEINSYSILFKVYLFT